MTDYAVSAVIGIVTLVVLVFGVVILGTKGKGRQAVSWRGFGVSFEVKPCEKCPLLKDK